MHNFKLVNCDTDSIMICKPDGKEFSIEEQEKLLEELNSLYPKKIKWESEGTIEKVIVLKAKNYVLVQKGHITYKGSAIKASQKEKALKEFIKRIIDNLIQDKTNHVELYNEYVKEIKNIKDIDRWCTRKTITNKTLTNERSNEKKVRDAIEGSDIKEGDRAYFFFKEDLSLDLMERFNGNYSRDKLYGKLYDTVMIFENVIDTNIFINYKLKRNKVLLENIK